MNNTCSNRVHVVVSVMTMKRSNYLDNSSEDEESAFEVLTSVDGENVGDFAEEIVHGARVAHVNLLDKRIQAETARTTHFRRVSKKPEVTRGLHQFEDVVASLHEGVDEIECRCVARWPRTVDSKLLLFVVAVVGATCRSVCRLVGLRSVHLRAEQLETLRTMVPVTKKSWCHM